MAKRFLDGNEKKVVKKTLYGLKHHYVSCSLQKIKILVGILLGTYVVNRFDIGLKNISLKKCG